MTSRSRVARAGALTVIAGALLLPAAAQADEPSCRGLPATIVVTQDGPTIGTTGPDVVVIQKAPREGFDAGDGDDVVCVDASTVGDRLVSVHLGPGADEYVGHDGGDFVYSDDDDAIDLIRTGSGADRVTSRTDGEPIVDDIDLGSGPDYAFLDGVPSGSFQGGDGRDELELWGAGRHDWAIDARDGGETTLDGQATGITGFESFQLTFLDWSSLDIVGGPENNVVDTLSNLRDLVEEGPRGRGPLTARLGAGSDRITIDGDHRGAIQAGPGHDRLIAKNRCGPHCGNGRVVVELAKNSLDLYGLADVPVRSFEDVSLEDFIRSSVWGDNGPNNLRVSGCLTETHGLGGDDRVGVYGAFECPARGQRVDVSAYGGAGDDWVVAEQWNGHGVARAIGGSGTDRCKAPRKIGCERFLH